MPAFAAHYLLAKDAKKLVQGSPLGIILEEKHQAFFWGAQGPDIFMYCSFLPSGAKIRRLSRLLHAGSAPQLLRAIAQHTFAQEADEPYLLCVAYLAGFLCHYCLDSAAHPYVFFHERALEALYPRASASARHTLIEAELDTLLCARRQTGGLSRFPAYEASAYDGALIDAVYKLYRAVLSDPDKQTLTKKRMTRCFRDARGLLALLFSNNPAVLAAARMLERAANRPLSFSAHMRPVKADAAWLNESRKPWHNLRQPDVPRTDTFMELYERALRRSGRMLTALDFALTSRSVPDFGADAPFNDGSGR